MDRLIISLVASLAICGCATDPTQERERAAVEARLLDYFQGLKTADRERLERAFAEEVAVMLSATPSDGGFKRREISELIERWSSNPNPPGMSEDYEILSIEIVDGRLATVTFRFTDRYYDAFLLIKHEGEWQIVTKAFIEQRGAAQDSE